ncbi:hypothetical protein ACQ859_06600 [Roseateles chitinivorans]|uniref:hypothetical protein n=1 Tax=Roseateles chitinivorans TaxID=2917965 RepID=UPI003D67A443
MGELAHRIAQGVDVLAEMEIQTGQAHGFVSSTTSAAASPGIRWMIRLTFT